MKKLLALFTFLLVGLSAQSQIDIPLSYSQYTTRYKDGEVLNKRYLTNKTYKANRVVRYENYDLDGVRQSWFQMVSDDQDQVIEEIWWNADYSDTIKNVYLDVGLWSVVRCWGEDNTHDTVRFHYDQGGLVRSKVEKTEYGRSVDSMFYEDSLMVKLVEYGYDQTIASYTTYRYNRKGFVYIQTEHEADGFVKRRMTFLYNSNGDVKEEHVQTYHKEAGYLNDDYAWFFKYDTEFKKVKTKYYNYVKKKKTLSKYKYDDQGRILSYYTRNKKEGTKQVYDFVYP